MPSRYEPGQVWTFHHRPLEGRSLVTILQVDVHPGGNFVHVRVEGLAIESDAAAGGVIDVISHMPFTEEAVDRSVRQLVGKTALPDFSDGYDSWRSAFDSGQAGVFSIPVAEAVDCMAVTIRQGSPINDPAD